MLIFTLIRGRERCIRLCWIALKLVVDVGTKHTIYILVIVVHVIVDVIVIVHTVNFPLTDVVGVQQVLH